MPLICCPFQRTGQQWRPGRTAYLPFPGVEASGIDSDTLNTTVKVQGLVSGTSEGTFSAVRAVSLGYLRAMGVPLVAGKWPSDNRTLDEVLVNESFARSLSQKGELLGRQVSGGFLNGRIVGVVADFKYSQMDAEPIPEVYTSYQLAPLMSPMTVHFFVRVGGTSAPDANALRRVVASIDPVYAVQTLQQSLSDSIAPRRFNLFLLGTFAAVALMMALLGIYGVIAYSVAERTQEIGIRMAVGADRGPHHRNGAAGRGEDYVIRGWHWFSRSVWTDTAHVESSV